MSRPATLLTSALLTRGLTTALRHRAPGGRDRWERKNHAGRTVDLYAGPASTGFFLTEELTSVALQRRDVDLRA
ncbi:hypothetical protein ABZX97_22835, partial [Streptomyces seoulensis]